MKVTLLDPSLRDHQGNRSINLGDVIIYESVAKQLSALFGDAAIFRISTHACLEKRHYDLIRTSDIVIIGGTNILSSDIRAYNQWKLSEQRYYYLFPELKNIVLFGVGWWQYQHAPTVTTKRFYRKILSKEFFHSVRDSYTRDMLASAGIANVFNTSCPTTWDLDGMATNRKNLACKNCLFMLTDYSRDPIADTRMIEIVFQYYPGDIYFFPQGSCDKEYLGSLEIYQKNKDKINILDHAVDAFYDCINTTDINYIGTRLHGGTKCLQRGIDTVIISIDNRAGEIANDIGLPAVKRSNLKMIEDWIIGREIFRPIRLPLDAIGKWKCQFSARVNY
jgi:polysaccharide pyruvyl transferase WcaK-like protein